MSSEGSSAPYSIAPIVISAPRGETMHAKDRALTRQRLENQAPGTFIGEMLLMLVATNCCQDRCGEEKPC